MFKVICYGKKATIFMGLIMTLASLTPLKAMAQSSINPLEGEWIKLSCDGEPGMSLTPDKQEKIRAALAENEQLQSLFGEFATQRLTGSLLDGFLAMAQYSLGQFRRESEGKSMALLTLFFDDKTLDMVSKEVKAQWQQEMQQACSNQ
ncbi:hypothetical protein VB715_11070 [Crocosphaera sp. UHCC 0190]|uniref:hypothetical protein n=1 Tax=Crocosphaera sp. UHCC 0190 TaxID=3110246 RepID=UPI002B21909A|nr:hypothetical protein [Crocosphaera sp. UHCC 0190]MEA5510304.1 hypothetical protein [Crocosphaera sp. UHCC 0190]